MSNKSIRTYYNPTKKQKVQTMIKSITKIKKTYKSNQSHDYKII